MLVKFVSEKKLIAEGWRLKHAVYRSNGSCIGYVDDMFPLFGKTINVEVEDYGPDDPKLLVVGYSYSPRFKARNWYKHHVTKIQSELVEILYD